MTTNVSDATLDKLQAILEQAAKLVTFPYKEVRAFHHENPEDRSIDLSAYDLAITLPDGLMLYMSIDKTFVEQSVGDFLANLIAAQWNTSYRVNKDYPREST